MAPASPEPDEGVFAGEPPDAVAGRDLVCVELARQFKRRIDPGRTQGLGGVGLTLWYAAGAAWAPARATEGWIEWGAHTSNLDWSSTGQDVAGFASALERSPAFRVAAAQRALALTVGTGEPDDLLVLGS